MALAPRRAQPALRSLRRPILIVYGIVPTLQPEGNFGRVYAAYGGIFIALSILWGWLIDNVQPDRFDIIGGIVALTGVAIIMYAPR